MGRPISLPAVWLVRQEAKVLGLQEEVPAHSEAKKNNAQPNKRVEKCSCPLVSFTCGWGRQAVTGSTHQSEVEGMGIMWKQKQAQ